MGVPDDDEVAAERRKKCQGKTGDNRKVVRRDKKGYDKRVTIKEVFQHPSTVTPLPSYMWRCCWNTKQHMYCSRPDTMIQ